MRLLQAQQWHVRMDVVAEVAFGVDSSYVKSDANNKSSFKAAGLRENVRSQPRISRSIVFVFQQGNLLSIVNFILSLGSQSVHLHEEQTLRIT